MDLPKPEELSCSWERRWTGSRKEKTFIHLEVLKWKKKHSQLIRAPLHIVTRCCCLRRRARIKIKLRVLFQLSICPWPTLHARRERLGTRPCSISVPPKKVGNISKRWEYFKKWGKFNQSPWTLIGLHYWSMEKMENDKKIKGTLTSALYSSPNGTARSGM